VALAGHKEVRGGRLGDEDLDKISKNITYNRLTKPLRTSPTTAFYTCNPIKEMGRGRDMLVL
jgi:hypothetical protein